MKLTEDQKQILDLIPAIVSINNKDHTVTWMNRYALKILQKEPEMIIGKKLDKVFPEQGSQYIEENQLIIETGLPLLNQLIEVEIAGVRKWYHSDKIPVKNERGEVEQIVNFLLDYSDHIREIQERIDSEFKYRALFDSSPESVTITDMKGNIQDFNEKTVKLLELEEDEIWNKNLLDLIEVNPEDVENYQNLINKTLKGKSIEPIELGIKVGPNKSKNKIIEVFPALLRKGENSYAIQIISRDVTTQRSAECALRESEKREAEERLKAQKLESIGILAGGIAHDFNNILTGVLGNLSLAELGLNDEDPDVKEALNDAKLALRQAKDLTQQLLTFSKGGAPVMRTINLKDLLTGNTNFVLRGSNCKAEFHITTDLWSVKADKSQIGQVLNNILINAMQSMPEGGIIKVIAQNIELEKKLIPDLEEGKYIKITIQDQGIGIPKKYIQKIFDPYFTTKERGSGLGLATSYSIIRKHNGYINVDSELGSGSKFMIYLPASSEIPREKSKRKSGIIHGKGKILIMDDEKVVRTVLQKMLHRLGYDALAVKDGKMAIEMYKKALEEKKPFDIVIMDLTIPGGLGGKDTITKLRELDPEIKAIVSSGYSNDPIMANYEEYGFKGVVKKPYRIDDLSQAIMEIL